MSQKVVDGFSGATPLALQKFEQTTTDTMQLLVGTTSGSIGETSSLLILVCGGYLVLRQMMDWRIPAAIILSTYIFAGLFYLSDTTLYSDPVFHLLSGGTDVGSSIYGHGYGGLPSHATLECGFTGQLSGF